MIASEARPDVARIRLDNALALFDEFVRATVKHPDSATLRGLEGRFAERLQIQPSYWSQIKSRARQIGERLARQFETLCRKPHGWLDEVHVSPMANRADTEAARRSALRESAATNMHHADRRFSELAPSSESLGHESAIDDDERFIVGLVLTYYRRHPQRARTRLLELLGEVLDVPAPDTPRAASSSRRAPVRSGAHLQAAIGPAKPGRAGKEAVDDGGMLWERTRKGVAPLKQKR